MDERLSKIEDQKRQALQESNDMYNGLLQNNQNLYDRTNQFAEQYEQQQNDILDKQLAYNERINQQNRERAQQSMEAEQKRAKNDFVSYTNPYGVQAETFASQGLLNSGVSETAKLGAYNSYNNRNASAYKTYQDATLQYDNEMAQARLNHDAQQAQNALEKYKSQLDALNNFYNNKGTITQNQLTNNQNLDTEYYNRYNTEYNNIQDELARQESIRQWEAEMAEKQRQYNESLAYQKEQDKIAQEQWQKEYELSKKAASSKSSGSGSGSSSISLSNGGSQKIYTNYYQGTINPDTQYGTMGTTDKNGVRYQPDNVNGKKLSKSGWKVSDIFGKGQVTGSTGASLDNQTIWKCEDGKYYIWDGSQNKYYSVTLASSVR